MALRLIRRHGPGHLQERSFAALPSRLRVSGMTVCFFVHPYTHESLMLPGNANLPIGGLQDAIQENGVPRRIGKSLTLRMTVDRRLPLLRSIRGRVARPFPRIVLDDCA